MYQNQKVKTFTVILLITIFLSSCTSKDKQFYKYLDGDMRWLTVTGDPDILAKVKVSVTFSKNEIIFSKKQLNLNAINTNKILIFEHGKYKNDTILNNNVFGIYSTNISYDNTLFGQFTSDFHFMRKYKLPDIGGKAYHPQSINFYKQNNAIYYVRSSRVNGAVSSEPAKLISLNDANSESLPSLLSNSLWQARHNNEINTQLNASK